MHAARRDSQTSSARGLINRTRDGSGRASVGEGDPRDALSSALRLIFSGPTLIWWFSVIWSVTGGGDVLWLT
jgi:hypothetical protein